MTSEVYSVTWIKPKHRFVKYNEYGHELLHLSKRFGFTDFSKDVDEINCNLSCELFYVDKHAGPLSAHQAPVCGL